MSQTPNIDYLREQVRILKALLDDPYPGRASWVMGYGKTMQSIVDFWNEDAGNTGDEPQVSGVPVQDAGVE